MSGYCTRDELYQLALSAQAFVTRPRPFDAVDSATATIRLKAHGYSTSDIVAFEVTDGGALPTGITQFAPYYPIPVTSDLLQIATTPNGPPISSWVDGGNGWGLAIDPGRRIDEHIAMAAAEIDEQLTADFPPIKVDDITGKFPAQLIALNARMAARAAVLSLQIENPEYRVAVDRLFSREQTDNAQLAIWRTGKPLNPRPIDQTDIPDNAASAVGRHPVHWRTNRIS